MPASAAEDANSDLGSFDELPEAEAEEAEGAEGAEEAEGVRAESDGIREHGHGTGKEAEADSLGAPVLGSSRTVAIREQAQPATSDKELGLDIGHAIKSMSTLWQLLQGLSISGSPSCRHMYLKCAADTCRLRRHIERFERASRTARIAPPPSSPDAAVHSSGATTGASRCES